MRLLIRAAAERIGLRPAELLAIELASVMQADEDSTVRCMSRILNDPDNCRAAIKTCVQRAWLEMLPTGLLGVTQEGQRVLAE
jgi:hypothetical protein